MRASIITSVARRHIRTRRAMMLLSCGRLRTLAHPLALLATTFAVSLSRHSLDLEGARVQRSSNLATQHHTLHLDRNRLIHACSLPTGDIIPANGDTCQSSTPGSPCILGLPRGSGSWCFMVVNDVETGCSSAPMEAPGPTNSAFIAKPRCSTTTPAPVATDSTTLVPDNTSEGSSSDHNLSDGEIAAIVVVVMIILVAVVVVVVVVLHPPPDKGSDNTDQTWQSSGEQRAPAPSALPVAQGSGAVLVAEHSGKPTPHSGKLSTV
jgi:hypothetical protein